MFALLWQASDHALCHCAGGWRGSLWVRSPAALSFLWQTMALRGASQSVGTHELVWAAKTAVGVSVRSHNSQLSCAWRSVDLHTLGEDEATQTPQQRHAAELIDACKEVFAFSGAACSPHTLGRLARCRGR